MEERELIDGNLITYKLDYGMTAHLAMQTKTFNLKTLMNNF